MVVIGVTGTKGKTSTANYLWSVLTASGYKVGQISSANIRIGEEGKLNDLHMSMPGRGAIARLLKKMSRARCDVAIIECTSEGMKQFRHVGIPFDVAILTNLTPEHLPSHNNSFEEYRDAKMKLFNVVASRKNRKTINGATIPTVNITWSQSREQRLFASLPADKHLTFALAPAVADLMATISSESVGGVTFHIQDDTYTTSLPGAFNVLNALPAILIAKVLKAPTTMVQSGIKALSDIPGRMECLQRKPFTVFVDYAHEKESMTVALIAVRNMIEKGKRVIVLLGAEGGGRDPRKRPLMGKVAAELANIVVVSNVDPYEDDPLTIINDIAVSAEQHGKIQNQNLFCVADRKEGIAKAIELAQEGDIVLITGKGAEQSITIGGKTLPWDDRQVVKDILSEHE